MKSKIFLLLLVVCSFGFAFGQTDTLKDNKRNHKYNWVCAVAINSVEAQIASPLISSWGGASSNLNVSGDKTEKSFSISVIPKYFISSDIHLRFEVGTTYLHLINDINSTNSFNHQVTNEELNQRIYRFNPGVQWSFMRKKYVELNFGIAICYTHYNDMVYSGYGEYRQMPSDTLLSWARVKVTYPGGFASGIGAFAGCNIYLQRHISFGAEFTSSLLYYKIGGENNNQQTYQILPNPPATSEAITESTLYKSLQFSKILTSFNISIWF